MAEMFDALEPAHEQALTAAPVFFVTTAAPQGRINLSPKGMDTLRVLSPSQIAYLDLTGSGNETAAHVLVDDRITLMICSFGRNALILRVYGHARSVKPQAAEWQDLHERFGQFPGVRQIFVIDIDAVQTSCGYAVPQMELIAERETLVKWTESKGEEGMIEYRELKNTVSIDRLPTGLNS
ncbi:MAG: pyridoxamine 5'-phosphate oxidase family protein [Novosphingobium sp.]|nr:pyridoxamine 5'-phosphate oxidase family protein [Novosphingobium sp.]